MFSSRFSRTEIPRLLRFSPQLTERTEENQHSTILAHDDPARWRSSPMLPLSLPIDQAQLTNTQWLNPSHPPCPSHASLCLPLPAARRPHRPTSTASSYPSGAHRVQLLCCATTTEGKQEGNAGAVGSGVGARWCPSGDARQPARLPAAPYIRCFYFIFSFLHVWEVTRLFHYNRTGTEVTETKFTRFLLLKKTNRSLFCENLIR
jgi:hypothetical protein